jgi:isopentenyldiphosphate isomerase
MTNTETLNKVPKQFTKLSDFIEQGRISREARERGEKICCNTSVGCIVENEKQEFLIIKRTKGELGFAGVAGHALDKLEDFTESMIAELSEEVGMEGISESDLIEILDAGAAYPNCCARKCGDKHLWKIYNLVVEGRPTKRTEDDGVAGVLWVKLDEIKRLVEETKEWYARGKDKEGEPKHEDHLEPVWVKHFAKAGLLDDMDLSWLNDLEAMNINMNE